MVSKSTRNLYHIISFWIWFITIQKKRDRLLNIHNYHYQIGFQKAEAELHDTPDRRAQGLRQIRELAKNDKHTKNIEFDDDFLLQYLRVRKYNVARAFSQLKALVALKKRYPLMFTHFNYDKTVKTISDKFITMLPWRCQDGCAILLVELDNWIPEEFPVEEIKRAVLVYLLQSLRYPMTQINGFKAILDLKSNPLRHLKHCTPNNIYLIYHGSQVSGEFFSHI
ncbi:hypothetical protein CEXT_599581 [Caerostris extrusa]|uniref:CRAL/TRIO N-terminal domain-containing protein n=1 Tax=Caerostris extrusa TaxID=172846 RepID=A0AAV4Y277_CAEEX|nr:hypothetical protein CEXT_599581 [Caerostris extrusa]